VNEFAPGEVVAPADPRIVLEGQWGLQPGLATTVNSGSRITFTFNGGRVQVLFDTDGLTVPPHLWITVDDGEPRLHVVEQPVIELAAEPGQHRVEIVVKDVNEFVNRWNPPFDCAVAFAGLVLDSSTRLRLSGRPSGPRLEFYGDSITQGVRALSAEPESAGADGTKSFAYLTARALGATAHQVGFGRQGIARPGNGEVPPGLDSFGWNFAGSPAGRVEDPQVVVLNLGVNDETLSPFSGKHAAAIEAAVKAADDETIWFVDTEGWITPDDCTDGLHPSTEGHAKIAAHLIEQLEVLTNLTRH
jgi:lysophospholipase L1-like esterase